MTKIDALRRALCLLDELDKLIDDIDPEFAKEFQDVRVSLSSEVPRAIDKNAPPEDAGVVKALRERWTAFLGVLEARLVERAKATAAPCAAPPRACARSRCRRAPRSRQR